jgi:hypothetical protein
MLAAITSLSIPSFGTKCSFIRGSGGCCGAIEFLSRLGVRASRSRRSRENMVRYLSFISKFSTLCVGL